MRLTDALNNMSVARIDLEDFVGTLCGGNALVRKSTIAALRKALKSDAHRICSVPCPAFIN